MVTAHEQKMDIIYTLPTSDFAAEFVSTKVNRMIQANDIFQEWTKDRNTVEQKQTSRSECNLLQRSSNW